MNKERTENKKELKKIAETLQDEIYSKSELFSFYYPMLESVKEKIAIIKIEEEEEAEE